MTIIALNQRAVLIDQELPRGTTELRKVDIPNRTRRVGLEVQRREIRQFVNTREYEVGKGVPMWSCGLVAVLILAAFIWLLA